MTALIIIGIILGALVLHFSIGNIAARLLSSKVAELSIETKRDGLKEYEWRSTTGEFYWLLEGWTKNPKDKWAKTGRTRITGDYKTEFSAEKFSSTMAFIRWFWFFGVPSVLNREVDKRMIEKYDPAVAERKQKALEAKIADLEKELEIEND